jgi:hypothetical protein
MNKGWILGRKRGPMAEETKEKISNNLKGKKRPEEVRIKISKTLKNHEVSKAIRQKISISGIGKHVGENNGNWKNGIIEDAGYILILCPHHPFCNSKKYVREHRLVMEEFIGRYLKAKEVVHHIDGNKKNNCIENLMLFPNDAEHQKFHRLNNMVAT